MRAHKKRLGTFGAGGFDKHPVACKLPMQRKKWSAGSPSLAAPIFLVGSFGPSYFGASHAAETRLGASAEISYSPPSAWAGR